MLPFALFAQNAKEERLVAHVKECLEKAEQGISGLDEAVFGLEGMSSRNIRCFLNNIASLPGICYLEVGCWKGSTLISAMNNNEDKGSDFIAIDNWSQFDGPRQEFLHNISTHLKSLDCLRFYETDCFGVDKMVFKNPVNAYFYDGDHSTECQEMAFTYFDDVFDDVFVAVVDDWNWLAPQMGTEQAITKLGYEVLFERQIFVNPIDVSTWGNGVYIAVLKKR